MSNNGNALAEPQALGKALADEVRRAVATQMGEIADQIAAEALGEILTEQARTDMAWAAKDAAIELLAATDDEAEQPEPPKKLRFETVEEFVTKYIAICYAREVSKPSQEDRIRWCPLWHEHPEAVARFNAMWRAFENMRLGGAAELSNWWRDHADHHMPIIMSPDGPFKCCSVHKGHNAGGRTLEPLPLKPAPAESFHEPIEQLDSGLVVITTPGRRGEVILEFE